ncbi:MAG: ATP-binding protein [Bacteroidota bacterium]|nr:ATP-binding protein [Bacteroidota bacterium]
MNLESSPFRPGQETPLELFTGREKEIERLVGMVRAASQGQLRVGFITGERGIGKSSLASFVHRLAETKEGIVGCHALLGDVADLSGMLSKVFNSILEESIQKPWHERVRNFFGDRVREVGIFGITLKLDLKSHDLDQLAMDFVPTIRKYLDTVKAQRKALLLILDDINGLAGSAKFANWFKSTVDQIAISRYRLPMCILMVGLEERRQELIKSQPSLARVFDLIDVAPWSDEEVSRFYRNAFESVGGTVFGTELKRLIEYTGGLPVLAHEIGHAVWLTASSKVISGEDVLKGILIAADEIGKKFLYPQVFQVIRSERYRSILWKISDSPRQSFRRSAILSQLAEGEKKAFDRFLRRMKSLGALQSDPLVRGGYNFPTRLHSLYFFMESLRARRGR